jgi:DNA-binding transcriptional regulator YiaG
MPIFAFETMEMTMNTEAKAAAKKRFKTPFKENIGAQIRAIRQGAGLTQIEFALSIGSNNYNNVVNWEHGWRVPDTPYLDAICDKFGYDVVLVKRKTESC